MATVTREQLQKIEWAGDALREAEAVCPACFAAESEGEHDVNCWLAAALASAPPAAPPEDAPRKAEHLLAASGVFKGHEGLRGLANAASFWVDHPYGTRLYYGDGGMDYLHRDVLMSAVRVLDTLAASAAPPEDARMKATADRLELALNGALLGRGVTVSQIQRTYRLNYSDAKRLHDFRGVCFDVLGVLLTAASAAPPDPPGLRITYVERACGCVYDSQQCRATPPHSAARQSDPPGLAQRAKMAERSSADNT